jgi:multiple sugar transport system ATP-binding protein
VAIGRAIVRQPTVFLFDEPLSNLDAALRTSMRLELSRLHRTLKTTMVYVTHDQVEAMTLGDRIAVFNQGRIEQLGSPMALYQQPANLFVASFLGTPRINLVARPAERASAVHRMLWSQAAPCAAPDPRATQLGLRAEHLGVQPPGAGVPAMVEHAENLGESSILHLRCEGLPELLHARVGTPCAAGQAVSLVLDSARALWFDASGQRLELSTPTP